MIDDVYWTEVPQNLDQMIKEDEEKRKLEQAKKSGPNNPIYFILGLLFILLLLRSGSSRKR